MAKKKARAYVTSIAATGYEAAKTTEDGLKRETYLLGKGQFLGGAIKDNSVTAITFEDIQLYLKEQLLVRNYHPAQDLESSDLVIVVHWGVTTVEDTWAELTGINPEEEYDNAVAESVDSDQEINSFPTITSPSFNDLDSGGASTQYSQRHNARMLGFDKVRNDKTLTDQEKSDLLAELENERYFIILMAYDCPSMYKEKEKKLLWSTRISIDSLGTNFIESAPALTRAAKGHFGTNLDRITKSVTEFGESKIKFGELEAKEVVEDKEDQ